MRLFLLFGFFFFSIIGNSQELQWAKSIRGDGDEYAYSVEVDEEGNSYTIGYHNGSLFVEYEPGEVIYNVYVYPNGDEIGIGRNGFLVKKDHDGNHMWHILLSEISELGDPNGVKIGTDGYLYACFMNSRFLTESDNLQGITEYADFITILKLDQDGNEIDRFEYRNFGYWPNGNISARTFDVDHNNNFYIGGTFTGTVNLDLDHPEFDLVNTQNTNAMSYVMKISNSGNILWSKVLDIYNYGLHPLIKVTPDNNLLVVINSNVNIGNYDILIKLNSNNGNILWDKNLPNDVSVMDFDVLPNGNIPIVYETPYWLPINFGTYNNEFWTQGLGVVIWYDNQGNLINGYEYPYFRLENISVDGDNNTYIMANSYSNNYIDLDPTENEHIVEESFLGGGFFVKFDETTDFVTALTLGQSSENGVTPYYACNLYFKDLKVHNDNYYITGDYRFNCDFDPSDNTYFVGDATWDITTTIDSFIMKIGSCEDIPPTGQPELSFCENENSSVSDLTPNQSYINWYDSIDSTTPLEDNVPLVNGQTYFATRQIGNCPESSERLEVLVTINPASPEPQVLNQDLCYNTSLTLADINVQGANLSFYNSLTEESSLDITTPLNPDTVYYISQNTTGCESNRVQIPLNLIITPVPDVNQQQNFCLISNPSLYDIEVQGENINWYNENQILLSGNTALTTSEILYVSQTIDGCESELFPVYVTITDTPIPQAETNQILCIDSNPTLNDVSINGENIKWYDENGNVFPQNTPITENITIYATQTIDNCESLQIIINITLQNSLNTNDYVFYLCDENNDNSEVINLSDYNQYLINNGIVQYFTFTYYNSYQNALNQTNPISTFSNYQSSTEIVYVRISSVINTCFDISELNINLISLPEISLTENIYYLCGDSPLQLQLPDNGNIDYVWFNGSTSTNITISEEGEYWVKAIKTENGISCESTHHFSVKKTEPIHIAEIKIKDWTENNNTITVLPYNENYIYSLNGLIFQNDNYFENLSIGKYTVYVKDIGDCDEFSDVVYLLNYPKFFTPNGDGINDYWRVKFSQFQEVFNVEIYDRYGKLITIFDKDSIGWDGKLNGENLLATDYWFKIIRVSDRKTIYKGHFALKR
jgi:gliding motility-associated-like protein